jgi:hypothetical protein
MTSKEPLFDLLPQERPAAFDALPEAEQAWRGRTYLMTWSLGGTEMFSWAVALNDEPVHNAEMKALAAQADDDLIRATVEGRLAAEQTTASLASPGAADPTPSERTETWQEFWDRLLAESRGQSQPSRVSLLVPSPRPNGDRQPLAYPEGRRARESEPG